MNSGKANSGPPPEDGGPLLENNPSEAGARLSTLPIIQGFVQISHSQDFSIKFPK